MICIELYTVMMRPPFFSFGEKDGMVDWWSCVMGLGEVRVSAPEHQLFWHHKRRLWERGVSR